MANSPFKGKKRLIIDLQEDIYKEAKKRTIDRNCTMTKWITRAIIEQLKKESARNE